VASRGAEEVSLSDAPDRDGKALPPAAIGSILSDTPLLSVNSHRTSAHANLLDSLDGCGTAEVLTFALGAKAIGALCPWPCHHLAA
jgi:hypothetical protein